MRALKFITGHVIYNPAYTYKFQLKTTIYWLYRLPYSHYEWNEMDIWFSAVLELKSRSLFERVIGK